MKGRRNKLSRDWQQQQQKQREEGQLWKGCTSPRVGLYARCLHDRPGPAHAPSPHTRISPRVMKSCTQRRQGHWSRNEIWPVENVCVCILTRARDSCCGCIVGVRSRLAQNFFLPPFFCCCRPSLSVCVCHPL